MGALYVPAPTGQSVKRLEKLCASVQSVYISECLAESVPKNIADRILWWFECAFVYGWSATGMALRTRFRPNTL